MNAPQLQPRQRDLVERNLPELAADLENIYFNKHLRVTLTTAIQSRWFEVVMTVFNPIRCQSFVTKVNMDDSSAKVSSPGVKDIAVANLEDVVDQLHLAVDQAVLAW